jgi:hypothetical protein
MGAPFTISTPAEFVSGLRELQSMPIITLPDGSQRVFDAPVSVHDVAAAIGAGTG